VQILEKAWAKLNGSYDKIVFGLSSEVLRAITGAPTITYDHDLVKSEELMKQLKDGVKCGYAILCSIDPEKYNYEESDLVSNFSYTVLGTYKVNTTKGNVKLIKIRNPWGNFEWSGDWSDSSKLWTRNIKEEVDFEENDKNIFYMSLEDYFENFNATVICKIEDEFENSRIEIKQDIGSHSIMKFQVNQDTRGFLTLSQLAYRIVPKEYNYKPYNAKMILARLDKDNKDYPLEYIDAICDEKDEIAIEADLVAGEYYIFCEIDWDENRPHDSFNVAFHGPQAVNLYEKNYPSFLEKALASCAMLKSQRNYYLDHKQDNSFRCMSIKDSNCEYGFVFYQNASSDAVLEEKINFTELENLELLAPYTGTSAKIKISAGKSKIIILKRLDRYCKFEVEYKTRFSFGEKKYLEEIYDKGKKIQVTYNKQPFDIWIYTMYGGSDFYFLMENHSEDKLCKAKFKLDLRNMHDIDNPSSESWVIDIYPGAKIVKKLSTTDSSKKSGVKYSYAFRVEEIVNDQDEIIAKVKDKGKKKQIQYNNEDYNIYFFSSFFQKRFYFLYENNEVDKVFEGNYKFTKTNLKIVGDEQADSIKVVLQPGESVLNTLVPIDPDQECTISYKYTYVVTNVDEE
jgi:calpain-15